MIRAQNSRFGKCMYTLFPGDHFATREDCVLATVTGMTHNALNRHLLKLQTAGLIRREQRQFHVVDHPHPMAQRLLRILQDSPVPRR